MFERSFVQQLRNNNLKQAKEHEQFSMSDRPKYVLMKPEQVEKLSPEERQKYEYFLKIIKTPKSYALRRSP